MWVDEMASRLNDVAPRNNKLIFLNKTLPLTWPDPGHFVNLPFHQLATSPT
jgi:hypothetical protein